MRVAALECDETAFFKCDTNCVPIEMILDKKYDCPFLEDETDVPKNRIQKKNKTENCTYDVYSTGMPKVNVFNLEKKCDKSECPPFFYLCSQSHYCVSVQLVCDGIADCLLGDDEFNCSILILSLYSCF